MIASAPPSPVQPPPTREDRLAQPWRHREAWAGLVLVLLAVGGLAEARLWRPELGFDGRANAQIAEAEAWWNGRLDLTERTWDTALLDNRVYNHFPPMFSFIAAAALAFSGDVPHWLLVALATCVPVLAYILFYLRTGSPSWGAMLAIGMVVGTSAFPVLDKTLRSASPYFVNQTLATVGLLIVLIDAFGRRRGWLAAIGLLIAALSRQLTMVYGLPLLWTAFKRPDGTRSAQACVVASLLLVVSTLATLNTLKFGHPLDTGYRHIYTGRDDPMAVEAKASGLFSAQYVPRNLYYANLGFPAVHRIIIAGKEERHLRPNSKGTGIWWTTPLLLWLVIDIRRILSDPVRRTWLAAAAIVFAALMCFHNTGFEQRGFNRFSLDYVPVLLALVAPDVITNRRRWITLVMVVWSVVYFRFLI